MLVSMLLSLSAAFSLFTTTYATLEYYYISRLTASDSKAYYFDSLVPDRIDRNELAQEVDSILLELSPWRLMARNALWASVMLIVASAGAQTLIEQGLSVHAFSVSVILGVSMLCVPVTVYRFRSRFMPLIKKYGNDERINKQNEVERITSFGVWTRAIR